MDEFKRERKMINSEKEVEENYTEDIANFFISALATEPSAKQSPQDCCAG